MNKRVAVIVVAVFTLILSFAAIVAAAAPMDPGEPLEPLAPAETTGAEGNTRIGTSGLISGLDINVNGNSADAVQVLILLTLVSLLPSILIMMTCFTRIIIVFSFLRNALGLPQAPPNQVLVGLALFLTIFIMQPIFTEINNNALTPYGDGIITQDEFFDEAEKPIKRFMFAQTRPDDINMMLDIGRRETPETLDDISLDVMIPSFVLSEVRRAFLMGFFLYIPFVVIDMVVASTLMSMGMVMMPPAMISLPFKVLLFVLVDGWGLLVKTLVTSFNSA